MRLFCNTNIWCEILLDVAAFDKQIFSDPNCYKPRLNALLNRQQTVHFTSDLKHGDILTMFSSGAGPGSRAL